MPNADDEPQLFADLEASIILRHVRPARRRSPRRRRPQASRAVASGGVPLARTGAAQARSTVDNAVAALLRFLGFVRNVERSKAQLTVAALLDGDAIARFLSFLLTTRRAAAARAAAGWAALLTHAPQGA